jgi:quinoprotein glucose dehydrogenase
MKRSLAVVIGCLVLSGLVVRAQSPTDWPTVVGDPGGMKYSPLTQITPANISQLKEAWTYERGGPSPIVIKNVLYFTVGSEVVALNAETGAEIWKFPLAQATEGAPVRRGVTYWPGQAPHAPRILVTLTNGKMVQLDASTGQLIPGSGVMDLENGIMAKFQGQAYAVAAPVALDKNIVIVVGRTGEQGRWGIPGDPRGFDLLTGKELWRFHVVPQPGDENFGTWGLNGWQDRRGPGSWQPMSVDNENGLVFIALGNATDQNYGATRPGDNLYAASVIALDATTGKRKWHFQTARHDIYDWDLNATPMFAEVVQNGRKVPVIVQMTKMGYIFVLNRLTGEPIFGVEDRIVPPTDAVGDKAALTQPFPVKPPPTSRDTMRRSEMAKLSPESEAYCTKIYDQSVNMGPHTPYGMVPSLSFPGSTGGGSNDGGAFDPVRGLIFSNARNVGTIAQLTPMVSSGVLPSFGKTKMPFDYYLDLEGYPCNAPPWAELFGINANTGDIVWRVTLGEYKELTARGIPKTGTATNSGAPMATASGLVFIGGTSDGQFRAFESTTGRELWSASPGFDVGGWSITYTGANGKQYVVVTGPKTVAYALSN